MKRAVSFFVLLACCGLLLADSPGTGRAAREQAPLLRDLVRMTNAGFSDETVLEYAKAHRAELPSLVSADDLLWLRKSGVSETVVRYMTAIDVRASEEGAGEDVAYDSAEAAGYGRYSPSGVSVPDEYDAASPDVRLRVRRHPATMTTGATRKPTTRTITRFSARDTTLIPSIFSSTTAVSSGDSTAAIMGSTAGVVGSTAGVMGSTAGVTGSTDAAEAASIAAG